MSQAEISKREILPRDPVGDNSQGSYEMSTSVSEGLLEQMDMSEAETGGISKEEKQAAESNDAEVRKEGEETLSVVKSTDLECSDLNGDIIHSENTSFHEDTKTERQTESASADRRNPC